MVEFGTSSAFRGWVKVRVLGYGFGVSSRKVKSRDCALASDLVRADVYVIGDFNMPDASLQLGRKCSFHEPTQWSVSKAHDIS